MNAYTVTMTGRYFVKATTEQEALDAVYEALLGNDPEGILRNGEVVAPDITTDVVKGHRYEVVYNDDDNFPAWGVYDTVTTEVLEWYATEAEAQQYLCIPDERP